MSEADYQHAKIFRDIVGYDQDGNPNIKDLVTYALYKEAKVEWLDGFMNEKGRSPNDQEFKAHQSTITSPNIKAFRHQAALLLEEYGEEYFGDELNAEILEIRASIEEAALTQKINEINGLIRSGHNDLKRFQWLSSITASVAGTAVIAVLVWGYFQTKPFWDAIETTQ